jgi:hypothetical protein
MRPSRARTLTAQTTRLAAWIIAEGYARGEAQTRSLLLLDLKAKIRKWIKEVLQPARRCHARESLAAGEAEAGGAN